MLCIDAAFLKTFLGGTLLSAIGIDGNNQMYPLAWAVAEGENNESWGWFLTNAKNCIGSSDTQGWTIISDQHKVIMAFKIYFPFICFQTMTNELDFFMC